MKNVKIQGKKFFDHVLPSFNCIVIVQIYYQDQHAKVYALNVAVRVKGVKMRMIVVTNVFLDQNCIRKMSGSELILHTVVGNAK